MSKSTRPFAIPKPPSDRWRGNEIHNELLVGFPIQNAVLIFEARIYPPESPRCAVGNRDAFRTNARHASFQCDRSSGKFAGGRNYHHQSRRGQNC